MLPVVPRAVGGNGYDAVCYTRGCGCKLPLPLVVPEVAPKVTLPPSGAGLGQGNSRCPETVLPPASFTVMVRVVEVAGVGAEIDDAPAVTVTVEPTICTGICADTVPAVAVTVAVRLALFPPQERVTVPGVVIGRRAQNTGIRGHMSPLRRITRHSRHLTR